MSIKIHWGANGSYKTAGAVMDDVVPAVKEGRIVISNIRGLTKEGCLAVFPNAPKTFDLIAIDLETQEGIELCRTWFQWAPRGALIIFDETQLIFLREWREKYLSRFDFPGGPEAAKEADRPMNWLDAWTRHRHWNWDIVLTTPNIKYVRTDIRQTCEGAFKHANFALLGAVAKKLFGDYKEVFHDAQLNVPPPKSIAKFRRIDKTVFKLYQSTATGKAQDTRAGTSLFASIPLMVGFGIIIICIGVLWYRGFNPLPGANRAKAPGATGVATAQVGAAQPGAKSTGVPAGTAVSATDPASLMVENFRKFTVRVMSWSNVNNVLIYHFGFFAGQDVAPQFVLDSNALTIFDFKFTLYGNCLVAIERKQSDFSSLATCLPNSYSPDVREEPAAI